MSNEIAQEILLPALNSTSEPPSLFDGTTRLFICYMCPFAQRPWIARNCKVPSMMHNGEVIGESLDLIKYIDDNFEGLPLLPDDSGKRKFSEELVGYSETFLRKVYMSFRGENPVQQAAGNFDYVETALKKFDDGPYFLGMTISLADIAYAPFIERFHGFFEDVWKHDITSGRPKLAAWFEEMNRIDAYKQTKCDMNKTIQDYKVRFLGQK